MPRPVPVAVIILMLLVSACSGTPGNSPGATATPAPSTDEQPTSSLSGEAPRSLTIWIAPQFDPDSGTQAGELFQERLDDFEGKHPGLELTLRIKASQGDGGLLQSLSSASVAAPQVVPDLITLDTHQLHAATLKGHLAALDGLVSAPRQLEWLSPIASNGVSQSGFYGVPFASNALVLAYTPSDYDEPPFSWSRLETGRGDFLFAAGDQQATTTLALYLAQGGTLQDETGRPSIDAGVLEEVLSFYSAVQARGLLPPVVRQFSTSDESWNSFVQNGGGSSVAWFQDVVTADPEGVTALPLPTRNGLGISLFSTWTWAMPTSEPDQQAIASQLIDWLLDPQFLSAWTSDLGLIPALSAALDRWEPGRPATLASLLTPVSQLMPSEEILATFGPPLQASVTAVLNGAETPASAAQAAAQAVRQP